MSSKVKAPATKKPAAPASYEDQWRSGRGRWGLQRFRRGRDHRIHFAGQKEDEIVAVVVRRHWWFLVVPALPLFGAVLIFSAVVWTSTVFPKLGVNFLWPFLELLAGLLILVALGWFIWADLIEWWYETYIITNKRIINSRGLLEPTRQETPIEKVTQVGVDFENPFGFLLDFGTVHVYITGGDIVMRNVPNPKKVKDAIQGISDKFQATKPKKEEPPVPQDDEMKKVLDTLAKGKAVPQLPDADEHYPEPRNANGLRRPRRTFGGPLKIPCDVRYTSGEQTVMYIQRSRYILYRNLAIPLVILLVLLPVSLYLPSLGVINSSIIAYWWFMVTLVTLGLLLWGGAAFINWADDVYILTSKRIIDIERRFIFFIEVRMEAEYKNIRDTKVLVPNVIERMLDIGNVYIETPGSSPDIVLHTVDHPFFLLDKIAEIKSIGDKVAAAKKFNEEKEELHKWFSNVITTLEHKSQLKGAPNVQNLEYLEAMERVSELGLNLVIVGEDMNEEIAAGHIITQSPPPGTIISPGGELQVLLSRQPGPGDYY